MIVSADMKNDDFPLWGEYSKLRKSWNKVVKMMRYFSFSIFPAESINIVWQTRYDDQLFGAVKLWMKVYLTLFMMLRKSHVWKYVCPKIYSLIIKM